jgi:hypothetical protein
MIAKPSVIHPQLRGTRTVRYVVNAGSLKLPITRGNLLSSAIFNTAGTTTNYRMFQSVRVTKVEMFSIYTQGTGTLPSTIGIEWISEAGPGWSMDDTSLGSSNPAHIVTRPPKDSMARMWSVTGSNESVVLFTLDVNVNDIIDVSFEFIVQDVLDFGAPTAYSSTAAGTVGTVYTTPLDGASGKATPIGISSLS